MKRILIISAITAASWGLAGCDKAPSTPATSTVSNTSNSVTKPAPNTVGAKIDDAKIVAAVNAELLKDSELSVLKINVDSTNGKVTLRGNAPTPLAKEKATTLARTVSDVSSVNNQLVVGETQIEKDASQLKDRAVNATNNAVDATKQKAAELKNDASRSLNDPNSSLNRTVDKVENKVDDAGINMAVNAGLANDPELSALKINVDVKNGTVLLQGTAPNKQARMRADNIAMGTKGVTLVDNRLVIAP